MILHFIHHKKINNKYEILQIDNILDDYSSYISEKLPIVIRNHNDLQINNIFSPLNILKKNLSLKTDKWIIHNKDILIIIPKEKISVNLLLPKYVSNFKKHSKFNGLKLLKQNNEKKNTPIKIMLDSNDKLIIPRFWVFNIENNIDVDIIYSHTIFSIFFSVFY